MKKIRARAWVEIRRHIVNILSEEWYRKRGKHYRKPCFLTAYQLAVLLTKFLDAEDPDLPDLRREMVDNVGGKGTTGPNSAANQIAWHLVKDLNGGCNDIEHQFFSLSGLDKNGFMFDNGEVPYENEFSMFRINPCSAKQCI